MKPRTPIRVLVVDDDEACYSIVKKGLPAENGPPFLVARAPTYETGIRMMEGSAHDVCLVDSTLGNRTGLEFLREASATGYPAPIIVVTDRDDPTRVEEALQAGAADCLSKPEINASILRRSIRYAVERRRAQDALRDSELKLHSVTECARDGIIIADAQGNIVFWNSSAETIFGYAGERLRGRPIAELLAESERRGYLERIAPNFESGVAFHLEMRGLSESGDEFPLELAVCRWKSSTGEFISWIVRDITDRHALRRALGELQKSHQELQATQLILIQAEKMESLGRLASGIAHEIKNPLSQILLGADFLAGAVGDSDPSMAIVLDDIRNAVIRADEIVRGLLDFSSADELNLEHRDLGKLVAESLELLHAELVASRVKVCAEFGKDLPKVAIDPVKLRHILINLTMNAIQAMSGGGQLLVKTFITTVAESGRDEGTRTVERLRAGDSVIVAEISDTGHGISTEDLPLIFDPFFTTRPTGKGAGLGLTVARKIMDLHGGRLEVRNRPEGGVTSAIMLKAKHITNQHS